MMPFYYGSRARSVPEYLRLRFDEKTRAFNALSFAAMTVFSSGISMYAMAKLLQLLHVLDAPFAALGLDPSWIFHVCIVVSAVIVLIYILLGGLSSAIYNEVLQFFLIVAGFVPLVYLGLRNAAVGAVSDRRCRRNLTHLWRGFGSASTNAMGVDAFGLAMGLGFVLSFGYWCTDFLVVQRAMAAHSMTAARRVPLIGAFPKMVFPFLVVMPGLIALAVHPSADAPVPAIIQSVGSVTPVDNGDNAGLIPYKFDEASDQIVRDSEGRPVRDYDLVIPVLLLRYFPAGMLGLGLTALMASFMSGMAGNVTAFNTVWTYDIYQAYIRKDASDAHYLTVGRLATVFGIAASVATAYVAAQFNNIMDILQLVFAFVNAPLLGTFLLGMFWKRTTGHGAFIGLLAGTSAAAIHQGLTLPAGAAVGVKGGWLGLLHTYPSEMAQNFYTAIWAFTVCFVLTVVVSLMTRPRPDAELVGLVHSLTEKPKEEPIAWYLRPVSLAVVIIVSLTVLNILFY